MGTVDLEISYRLARYASGEESLADFRRWLLPLVWELAEPNSEEVSQLANRVELRLAEFMNGHWTEEDLRRLLQQLVPETSGIVVELGATAGFEVPSRGEFVPA